MTSIEQDGIVCEWRPGCYTTSGVLSDWGIPATCYGVMRTHIQNLLAPHVSMYRRGDIFLLIGQASTPLEIDDFKRDSIHLHPRYLIMITPEWVQDLSIVDEFATCQTSVDSATLGDVCGARWWVCGANGISSDDFRVRLTSNDLRVLHQAYQLAGVPCSQDPHGQASIMGIPRSIGRSVVITDLIDGHRTRSRHSHVPLPNMAVSRGQAAHWPLVSPEQRPVTIGERIVSLGGNPTLGLAGTLDHSDAEQMMGSYYPRDVARQSLWAARCRYDDGHFRHFLSRAGLRKGVDINTVTFFPT